MILRRGSGRPRPAASRPGQGACFTTRNPEPQRGPPAAAAAAQAGPGTATRAHWEAPEAKKQERGSESAKQGPDTRTGRRPRDPRPRGRDHPTSKDGDHQTRTANEGGRRPAHRARSTDPSTSGATGAGRAGTNGRREADPNPRRRRSSQQTRVGDGQEARQQPRHRRRHGKQPEAPATAIFHLCAISLLLRILAAQTSGPWEWDPRAGKPRSRDKWAARVSKRRLLRIDEKGGRRLFAVSAAGAVDDAWPAGRPGWDSQAKRNDHRQQPMMQHCRGSSLGSSASLESVGSWARRSSHAHAHAHAPVSKSQSVSLGHETGIIKAAPLGTADHQSRRKVAITVSVDM